MNLKSIEKNFFSSFFIESLSKQLRKVFINKINSKNIVILSTHRIGDSVLTIPAIESIQKFFSDYTIIIVCFENAQFIYNYYFNGRIQVFPIHALNSWVSKRFPSIELIRKIRKFSPEILFDLTTCLYSYLFALTVGAKQNIGMNKENLKSVYDLFVVKRNSPHLMDMYLDVAKLVIPPDEMVESKQFQPQINRNGVILINTLAGWDAKEWGLMNFINVALELKKRYHVKFIHQKNSMDSTIIEKYGFVNIETDTIEELVCNLQECSIFIGNDSGPIHIANMLGKPTYSIYGPTNPDFSMPFGSHHRYIRKSLKCTPFVEKYCFLDGGHKCKTRECLKQLTSEEVLNDLKAFLNYLEIRSNN